MNIKEILNKFKDSKISVIGDVMLDHYIYGSVERISPEAPVPIIKSQREVYSLGGAANVAANIASFGANVILFGYMGKDHSGEILKQKLKDKKIEAKLFPVLSETTKKNRVIGNNQQQILRIDKEGYSEATYKAENFMAYSVYDNKPDVVIISDYAKHVMTNGVFSKIKEFNKNSKILVDPKPKSRISYNGVYLITPNLKEAKEMSGLEDVNEAGKKLKKELNTNVLITRGKDGMTLFYKNNHGDRVFNVFTEAKEVYDVTGAGDTAIGILGLGIASGLNLEDSVFLSNHAAGIVVGKAGAAIVSAFELEQVIEEESNKLKTLEELLSIREDCMRKSKKIVWTNGCFDILHEGHVDYLRKAKSLGDYLIVGINDDKSIRELKGEDRPINKKESRVNVLSELNCVDYITVFKGLTPAKCLKKLKPDFYIKAGDYTVDTINQDERKLVEDYGGKIIIIPVVYEISTTKIIKKIKENK